MNASNADTLAVRSSSRRYWKRLDQPSGGWWPWGWLPLLGLLLLLLYGLFAIAPAMEAQTRAQVKSALDAANLTGLEVQADGQHVTVVGEGSEALRAAVTAVARGAVCDTWLANEVVCPTRVHVALTTPQDKSETESAPLAGKPLPRLHSFTFTRIDSGVRLEGEVPSAEVRNRIARDARNVFADVDNRLRITRELATDQHKWAASKALAMLQLLRSGMATWQQGSLSVSGVVDEQAEANVRSAFAAGGERGSLGELDLTVLSAAASCNDKFAAALSDATIQFQTGSAAISAASQPLLQRLAELARECPIQLDVEGHTDNVGGEQMNRDLSQARAEAVVAALEQLGIDGARLTPRGYGPSRPIADNATREGRARNRRIEIKASEPR